MGLVHSGELADAALATRMELPYAGLRSVQQSTGVIGYWRFRDDILVATSQRRKDLEFMKAIKTRAGYFKLEFEVPQRISIDYMQLTITIANEKLIVKPFFKPTALGPPLEATSAHPPSVHVGWPAAMVHSFGDISTSSVEAKSAKETYIARFVRHKAPQSIVDLMTRTVPRGISSTGHRSSEAKHLGLWMILSFHPAWRIPIQRAVQFFASAPEWIQLYTRAFESGQPPIRIAWKGWLASLTTIVKGRRLG